MLERYPGETDQHYWDRMQEEEHEERKKRRQRQEAGPDSLFLLLQFVLFLLKCIAIFGLFVYAGYLLSQKVLGEEAEKFQLVCGSILFTYLIFCLIYFLKGIIIGLRSKNNILWILPWTICVLLSCVVPAWILKTLVTVILFNPIHQQENWQIGIGWGVFVLTLFYVYDIHQFKTPTAPRVLYWSFALGWRAFR